MKVKLLFFMALAIAFSFNSLAQIDDLEDPVLHLSFDDEEDLGANDQDIGILEATAEYNADGVFGGCAEFDGETTWIITEQDDAITQLEPFTWSFWFQTDEVEITHAVMKIGYASGDTDTDGWDQGAVGFFLNESDGLSMDCSWVNQIGTDEDAGITDGDWHHIVWSVGGDPAGTLISAYIDGVAVLEDEELGDFSEADDSDFTDDVMVLGYMAPGSDPEPFPEGDPVNLMFIGLLDDFRFYAGAATAGDAADLFELEVGLQNVVEESLVNVYPNPASEYLMVDRDANISIYNAIGQEVLRMNDYTRNSQINVSNLESGIYVLKARFENRVAFSKVMVR